MVAICQSQLLKLTYTLHHHQGPKKLLSHAEAIQNRQVRGLLANEVFHKKVR